MKKRSVLDERITYDAPPDKSLKSRKYARSTLLQEKVLPSIGPA